MRVNEIFYSIQGESTFAGLSCVFVRLTGCNLRCKYCDTTYAYFEGFDATIEEIEQKVLEYSCSLVEITGGEPLLQTETVELAQRFVDKGMQVLVETNGTQDIEVLPWPIIRIVDIKCPGSGESENTNWKNLDQLRTGDEVKFVITCREDFDWAVSFVKQYDLISRVPVLFSPAFGLVQPKNLAEWLLASKLAIRLQLQLHKYIWHPTKRGV